MVDSDIDGSNEFNEKKIIAEFRANEGRVGGLLAGTPLAGATRDCLCQAKPSIGLEPMTPSLPSARGSGRLGSFAALGTPAGVSRRFCGWLWVGSGRLMLPKSFQSESRLATSFVSPRLLLAQARPARVGRASRRTCMCETMRR
jgi:hypothetical protein